VFSWLFTIARSPSLHLAEEALRAMNSWMRLLCIWEWPEVNAFTETLVSFCENSARCAKDNLCDLTLEVLSGIIGDPNSHMYPSHILTLLDKIIPLQPSLDIILQRDEMVCISIT